MITKRYFSEELLSDTKEKRMQYFKDLTVMHAKLKNVLFETLRYINNPAGFSFVIVSGPSGIGKTKLCNRLVEFVLSEQFKLENKIGDIPIVAVEVAAPDSGIFSWKDYYIRVLKEMKEPLINKKVDYSKILSNSNKKEYIDPSNPRTSSELRRAMESALYNRNTKTLIVDEAQHFTKVVSARRLQDQLDVIKSIANKTNVTHILVGTYELNSLININEQLSRRSIEIHFSRYKADNNNDRSEFIKIIYSFQKHLPLDEEPNLVEHWEYIYERTVGCVGILKDWLTRCLDDAINEKHKTIDLNILKKNAFTTNKIQAIINEIKEGEKKFTESQDEILQLRTTLGLENNAEKETKKGNFANKNHDVAKRKPKRDEVGTNNVK